jgi:hypothetical protein
MDALNSITSAAKAPPAKEQTASNAITVFFMIIPLSLTFLFWLTQTNLC